jgi:hypothetical protein
MQPHHLATLKQHFLKRCPAKFGHTQVGVLETAANENHIRKISLGKITVPEFAIFILPQLQGFRFKINLIKNFVRHPLPICHLKY